jgi:hypothetical protein
MQRSVEIQFTGMQENGDERRLKSIPKPTLLDILLGGHKLPRALARG